MTRWLCYEELCYEELCYEDELRFWNLSSSKPEGRPVEGVILFERTPVLTIQAAEVTPANFDWPEKGVSAIVIAIDSRF